LVTSLSTLPPADSYGTEASVALRPVAVWIVQSEDMVTKSARYLNLVRPFSKGL
jgi:hypothetical protein